jgi:pimeloyl-ACP methyl ester carboxylesterase
MRQTNLLILTGLFLLSRGPAWADPFAPCADGPPGAVCGRIQVPEDRTVAGGRTIDLYVVRLRAQDPRSELEPVFYLAGGPGEAASEMAADLPEPLAVLRRRHDLIFVDQRGTGRSNPLSCPGSELAVADVRACRAALETTADLRRYTTWDAVEDLDAVRQALGYGRIDLIGASYGTQVAQAYLRRHADHVRAAVLIGALPLLPDSLLFDGRDAQRALHLLLQDCAADAACAAAFPNLAAETDEVFRRLREKPVRVTVTELKDPPGPSQEIVFDLETFATTLRTRLYSAKAQSRVPLALHQAYAGDYLPMARAAVAIGRRQNRNASLGMFLSVLCAETAPFLDPAAVERLGEGTFFGAARTLGWLHTCHEWPHAGLPPDATTPLRTTVPVLILSGRLDPVTPPYWGEQVAAFLPNARQVLFAASSHFPDGHCAAALAAQFLEKSSSAGLDVRCAETETRPAFVLTP